MIAQSATAVLLLAIVGVRDDDLVTLGYAITRPLLIVAVSVAVSIVIARLLRRRRLLDTQTIADAGMQAWDAAARAELATARRCCARGSSPS